MLVKLCVNLGITYDLYRKILDDLSAADPTLQKTGNSDLMSSAAVLQAQQLQAALQQVASSGGLTNTSLLPGLLQGTSSSSGGDQISSQLSVMLPAQQQVTACEIKILCEHNLNDRYNSSLPYFNL